MSPRGDIIKVARHCGLPQPPQLPQRVDGFPITNGRSFQTAREPRWLIELAAVASAVTAGSVGTAASATT